MKAKEVMKKITLSLVAASMLLTAIPASAAEFSDGGEYESSLEMDSSSTEQAFTEFSDGAGDDTSDVNDTPNVDDTPDVEDENELSANSYSSYAWEYESLPAATKKNCVSFARYKVPSLPGGLLTYQNKVNIINSHVARVGAIAITRGNSSYGHVAYVEAVNGNNVTTLNGGWGNGQHIGRWTGTESEQGIVGYWYPAYMNTSVNVSWSEWEVGTTQTNSTIYSKITTSQRVHFTGAGVSIWDASGRLIKQKSETTSVNNTYMNIWYNVNSELGMTLSPGSSYTYQMYADFGGKRYYGNKKTFRTVSAPASTNNSDNTRVVTPNPTVTSTNSRQVQVSWSRYNSADRYQVQYCYNRFFLGAGNKYMSGNRLYINGVRSRRYYYVRVRSYRQINGRTVYSAWSSVKSVRVK